MGTVVIRGLPQEAVPSDAPKKRVLRVVTGVGSVFYTDEYSPERCAEIAARCDPLGGVMTMELIPMTEEQYKRIPATAASAELFR